MAKAKSVSGWEMATLEGDRENCEIWLKPLVFLFMENDYQLKPVIYEAPSGYAMDLVRYAFRGGHADVGGGYAKRGLANITFDFMFEAGKSVGVPFKPLSRTFMDTMKHSKIDGEFITHEMMWHQEYPAYNVKYEARHLPAAIKRHWIVNELKAPSGPGNAFEYKKKKIFMPYHN